MKYEPIAKHFYDGLDEGKFLGLKCPDCGGIEFPPYPACNQCGHIGNEWVDISDADVIIDEIYSVSPMMTIGDFMPFAPIFSCEAHIEEGNIEFTCLVFGVNKKNYKEIREQVPLHAKLCVLPMPGYNSFAVTLDGTLPERKGEAGVMDTAAVISALGTDRMKSAENDSAEPKPDNGIDGNYKCTAKVMGQKRACKLSVFVDGNVARGELEVMDQVMPYEGTYDNGTLNFRTPARGSEFVFDGTVGNNKLEGKMKFGAFKMTVSGDRV